MSSEMTDLSPIAMRIHRAKVVVRRMPDDQLRALYLAAQASLLWHMLGQFQVIPDHPPAQVAEDFIQDLLSKIDVDPDADLTILGMGEVNSFPVALPLPELFVVAADEQRERAGIPLFDDSAIEPDDLDGQ